MSIRDLRLALGESVEELAEAFQITPEQWLRYEAEGAPPEFEREFEKIAKVALSSRESKPPEPWPFPTEKVEPKPIDPEEESDPFPYCLTGALATVEELEAKGIRAQVRNGRVHILDEATPSEPTNDVTPTIREASRSGDNEAMRAIVSLQNQLRSSEEAHDTTLLLVRFFCCLAVAFFVAGKDGTIDTGLVLLPLFLVVEGLYRLWKSKDD